MTQRGNRRQKTFFNNKDYTTYMMSIGNSKRCLNFLKKKILQSNTILQTYQLLLNFKTKRWRFYHTMRCKELLC